LPHPVGRRLRDGQGVLRKCSDRPAEGSQRDSLSRLAQGRRTGVAEEHAHPACWGGVAAGQHVSCLEGEQDRELWVVGGGGDDRPTRYLIHDRDPLFTQRFSEILLSARAECLRRVIPLGENHLRTILSEFIAHCHFERNHQGRENELLTPLPANSNADGPIHCRERLGGILNHYHRDAA
jgi:hypothetical protein